MWAFSCRYYEVCLVYMILGTSSERSDVGIKGHILICLRFGCSSERSDVGTKVYFLVLFEFRGLM